MQLPQVVISALVWIAAPALAAVPPLVGLAKSGAEAPINISVPPSEESVKNLLDVMKTHKTG